MPGKFHMPDGYTKHNSLQTQQIFTGLVHDKLPSFLTLHMFNAYACEYLNVVNFI